MYVILRDKGTIFHDGGQDVSVTGTVPVKVRATPKVNKAVSDGILIKVDDKEAEAQVAKAAGKAKAGKDSHAAVAVLEGQVKTLEGELELAGSVASTDKETIGQLTTAVELATGTITDLETANVQLTGDLEKANEELVTLRTGKEAADKLVEQLYKDIKGLTADVAAKDKAYATLKESIAKK